MWSFKRDGLPSGVEICIFMFKFTLAIGPRPFSRALTGPIFGPIPNAKLKFFFPIEKINSQLKKLNIFFLKSIKSILNLSHAKHVPQASSMMYTHQIDCGWGFLREAPLTQSVVSAVGGRHWLRLCVVSDNRGFVTTIFILSVWLFIC